MGAILRGFSKGNYPGRPTQTRPYEACGRSRRPWMAVPRVRSGGAGEHGGGREFGVASTKALSAVAPPALLPRL